jgi:signal recognition particle subunit SRP54
MRSPTLATLEKLSSSLSEALRKIFRAPLVDEAVVKELNRDIQRALLQSDVNVRLVLDLSKSIEKKILEEKLPPGISRREHVVKVVYEELTKFLGEKTETIQVQPGKTKILMLVGIQGSGKTTSAAKIGRFFQKRGVKSALICADTYRPGAFEQLEQLSERIRIPIYGDKSEKNAIKIASQGVNDFKREGVNLIIVDTAGRHKDEKSLIIEMKEIAKAINPDEIILAIDATIGQQASIQAEAFNAATKIGSILLTKLDGSARGGGALSAVAATGAPIKFIGVGEDVEDLEAFVPSRFVGRLIGMGDIEGLVQKVRDAEISIPDKKAKDFLSGKFTLEDLYEQMQGMRSMGPLKSILKMLPGGGLNIPDDAMSVAEDRFEKWGYAIQSMTKDERENPKMINASRYRRIARGSGVNEREVRELIKQYNQMRKLMKTFRKRRIPPQLMRWFSKGQV